MSEHATPLRGIGEIGLIPDDLDHTPHRGIGEIGLIPDDLDDTPLRGIGEIGLIPADVINPDCSDSPQGGRVTADVINPDCSDSPQGGRVTASGINPDCSDSPQGGGVAQMTDHERKTTEMTNFHPFTTDPTPEFQQLAAALDGWLKSEYHEHGRRRTFSEVDQMLAALNRAVHAADYCDPCDPAAPMSYPHEMVSDGDGWEARYHCPTCNRPHRCWWGSLTNVLAMA